MNSGRLIIAIGHFTKCCSLEPNNGIPWHAKAWCIHKYCEYSASRIYFKEAARRGVYEIEDMWLWVGESYLRSGKYLQAFKALSFGEKLGSHRDKDRAYEFLFKSVEGIYAPKLHKADYCDDIVLSIKKEIGVEEVVCMGDSHVLLLEGVNELNVFQTGSPTAYNLLNENSSTGAINIIRSILSNYNPQKTACILNYAELDIRNHIYKHVAQGTKGLFECCEIVVDRYMQVLKEVKGYGFQAMAIGPFGSGLGTPRHGEIKERGIIACTIDALLKKSCEDENIPYSSMISTIVRSDYQHSNSFFGNVDDNHLDKCREIKFHLLAQLLESVSIHRRRGSAYYKNIQPVQRRLDFEGRDLFALAWVETEFHDEPKPCLLKERKLSSLSGNFGCINRLVISLKNHYILDEVSLSMLSSVDLFNCRISIYDSEWNGNLLRSQVEQCSSDRNALVARNFESEKAWYIEISGLVNCTIEKIDAINICATYTSFESG